MALNGDCQKQDFSLLPKSPVPSSGATIVNPFPSSECCFVLPALAEVDFTNELNNDQYSKCWFFSALFTSAVMTLQKWNGNAFVDVATLTDNTYGTMYAFGFFVNKYQQSMVGYLINWANVLNADGLGEGNYQIKIVATPVIGATFTDYSFEFFLQKYTVYRANKTTRFSWIRNGQYGDPQDDTLCVDYGTINWFNQLRLPKSIFGFDEGEDTRESVKYQTGAVIWTKNSKIITYKFTGQLYPYWLHRFLETDMLAGDNITVTDYNFENPTIHQNTLVMPSSGYKPTWMRVAKYASIELTFVQAFQNFVKKRD